MVFTVETSSLTTETEACSDGLSKNRGGMLKVLDYLHTHTKIQVDKYSMHHGVCTDTQNVAWNNATWGIGSIAHMTFCLFKVRLSNGAFGDRWLTPTHWCAQRLWLKNGECEWAVGSVFVAQSNMLRPVYWNVSYSHPNNPPAGQQPSAEHLTAVLIVFLQVRVSQPHFIILLPL